MNNERLKSFLLEIIYLLVTAVTTAITSYFTFQELRNPSISSESGLIEPIGVCNTDESGREMILRNTVINTTLNLGLFPLMRVLGNPRRVNPLHFLITALPYSLVSAATTDLIRSTTMPSLDDNENLLASGAIGISQGCIISVLSFISLPLLALIFPPGNNAQIQNDRINERARRQRVFFNLGRKVNVNQEEYDKIKALIENISEPNKNILSNRTTRIQQRAAEELRMTIESVFRYFIANKTTHLIPLYILKYNLQILKTLRNNLRNSEELFEFLDSYKINFDDFSEHVGPKGLKISMKYPQRFIDEVKKDNSGKTLQTVMFNLLRTQYQYEKVNIDTVREAIPTIPKAARPN